MLKSYGADFINEWRVAPNEATVAFLSPMFLYQRAFAMFGAPDDPQGPRVFDPYSPGWFVAGNATDEPLDIDLWKYLSGMDNPAYAPSWTPWGLATTGLSSIGHAVGLSEREIPWLPNPGVPWAVFPELSERFSVDAGWSAALGAGDGSPLAMFGEAIYRACEVLAVHDGGRLKRDEWRGPWPPGFEITSTTGAYVVLKADGTLAVFPWEIGRELDVASLEPILAAAAWAAYQRDPEGMEGLAIRNAVDAGAPPATVVGQLPGEIAARARGDKPLVDIPKTWRYLFGEELPAGTASTATTVAKALFWLAMAWVGVRAVEAIRK